MLIKPVVLWRCGSRCGRRLCLRSLLPASVRSVPLIVSCGSTRFLKHKGPTSFSVNEQLFFCITFRYLGHVDLLKFLVESNCGDIPSLRDLMHPDSAR